MSNEVTPEDAGKLEDALNVLAARIDYLKALREELDGLKGQLDQIAADVKDLGNRE